MTPAAVARCRVLELGCGNGNNLIPMAYALPQSRFLGVDLAEQPIAAGSTRIEELGLTNISLRASDLEEVGGDSGEFDYIIAHGLYSWIAPDVRERLLAVCRERLAPQGIAFVSYNALPGCHVRLMLREMMLYHTRQASTNAQQLEKALEFVQLLREQTLTPKPLRPMLDDELKAMLKRPPESFYHDDLEAVNEPVYFHEFAAHAARHGLQFLGEAELFEMFDHRHALDWLGDNVLEREQYLDFLKLRRFRQTLLCHQGVRLKRTPQESRMDEFFFSSPARQVDGRIEGAHHASISAVSAAVERTAGALRDAFPLPLPFEELLPYAGNAESLREILFGMVTGGFADLHVYAFPCQETVTARPAASALARLEASESLTVTSLCHRVVKLDEIGRRLLLLLDGSRDHATISAELAAIPGAPRGSEIREYLPQSLEWMARMALLEG